MRSTNAARGILAEPGRQDRDVAEAVEAAVIGRQVGELNARQLRSRLKSLVHRLAPERAEERRARAEADRRVRVSPAEDGMAWVEALMRAEDDRTCKAPGCALPATRCDLDHVRAFADGGATCAGNLTPLCRKHHLIKHHGPFVVDQPEPGTLRWTSPTGNTTVVGPARVGPVHDPPEPDDPPF